MDASSLPLACYWHASGLPLEDSVIRRPRTAPAQAQCLGGGGLGSCLSGRHVAYCLARGPSGGLPMWAGLFHAAPVRFLRCLHCNRHCGGMRRHCEPDGTSAGAAERRLERPIADDMMRLPHWRGIRARCHHARLRTTRTMGLSKRPKAASRRRRAFGVYVICLLFPSPHVKG